jgi:DNA-binding transcriptional ArsR family regulator
MTAAVDRLDATFTALADPTRRAIVARLAKGDATVNNLATPFDMTLPAISKHLKVLERCGLISRSRRAQFRPCHLEAEALDAAANWIEENRRVWTERFDKLDQHLRDIQRAPAAKKQEKKQETRTEARIRQTNVPEAARSPEAQAGFLTSLDRFAAYLKPLSGATSRADLG